MNDDLKKVAKSMAALYINFEKDEKYSRMDGIWDSAGILNKTFPGFWDEFRANESHFREMVRNFTPEMMEQARQMFTEKV